MSDEIDDLPPLRDVIAQAGLQARKNLGQNFLLDLNVTDKIARAAGNLEGMTVFEIGPGPGGLTRSLLKTPAKKVIAVEYDPRAIAALEPLKTAAKGRLDIVHGDALDADLTGLAPAPRAIAANLPYNIATPLLLGWLRKIAADRDAFSSMTLMFQREVVDRLTAQPSTKNYGRLSVMTQWLCEAKRLFDLPPSAFTPPPKITSSIVRLVPHADEADIATFEKLEKLTAAAFGQRRKMLRSSLKNYLPALEQAGIDPALRAENLPVTDYIRLAERRP